MSSYINDLTSRVVAVRTEFQVKVVDPIFLAVQSDVQALRQLGEEVARLSALIEETEVKAQEMSAANDKLAREIFERW